MAQNTQQTEKELTFEEALARLQQILQSLESGNAPLDDSLAMYEEGVRLVKLCNQKLDSAQQRVKILETGEDGNYSEQDFTKTE